MKGRVEGRKSRGFPGTVSRNGSFQHFYYGCQCHAAFACDVLLKL